MTIFDRIIEAQRLLGQNCDSAASSEEKETYRLCIDALWFIWTNGQADELESYRAEVAAGAPERVIASFTTRDEAEAWLKNHPHPPHLALVLVADEYHVVLSSREPAHRALIPDSALEYHLEDMMKKGLPPTVASFTTREEADAWFHQQVDPPVQSVIQIGTEPYLAVFFRNIHCRVLFAFARVERLRERRARRRGNAAE